MYDEIVSWNNVCHAYLDLYSTFTEKAKMMRYRGIEGCALYESELDIVNVLKEVQEELINKKPLLPARYSEMPKKGGGVRGIFQLSVKDRIKCEAIKRIIEPYFENIYSDYLYSFRSTKPSYYASRSVRRFYLRNHNSKKMYVLRMDITKYADSLNHQYLYSILRKNGLEEKVIDLIELALHQSYYKNGTLMSYSKGTYQGMSFFTTLMNIYVNHIDEYVAQRVKFYRRMGDDYIIFDDNKENILKIKEYIEEEAKKAHLKFNEKKGQFGKINELVFDFHGMQYNKSKVQLPGKNIERIMTNWRRYFKYDKSLSQKTRIRRLKEYLQDDRKLRNHYFAQYIRAYQFVTDTQQIQYLSKHFFKILSKYFTGKFTYRSMKKTKKILKGIKFPSLTKHYYLRTNGLMNKKL